MVQLATDRTTSALIQPHGYRKDIVQPAGLATFSRGCFVVEHLNALSVGCSEPIP